MIAGQYLHGGSISGKVEPIPEMYDNEPLYKYFARVGPEWFVGLSSTFCNCAFFARRVESSEDADTLTTSVVLSPIHYSGKALYKLIQAFKIKRVEDIPVVLSV